MKSEQFPTRIFPARDGDPCPTICREISHAGGGSRRRAAAPARRAFVFRVAQICNLPYRRFVIGRASESSSALTLADPSSGGPAEGGRAAECTSAIQQLTNLRYAKQKPPLCSTAPKRSPIGQEKKQSNE